MKTNHRRVRNVKPFRSKILYILVWTGRIKDNNLLLKIEIDSEFLILRYKLNQSFGVEGRKRVLVTIFSAVESEYTAVSCSGVCFTFWNKVY